MKKFIYTAALICIYTITNSQSWQPDSPNIYFNGGSVGIGTTAISNSTLTLGRMQGYANIKGGNVNGGHLIIDSYNAASGVFLNHYNNANVYLATGGGKVGVGTETPNALLSVNGRGQLNSLDVGGERNSNSYPTGLNVYDPDGSIYTNMQFAQRAWGGSHAILFNAYKSNSIVDGDLSTSGNTKYSNDVGSFSSGAALIHYGGNGGYMDFFISPNSTGQNTNVDWQTPILSLRRGGNVGIGTSNPDAKLAVKGTIHAQEVKVDLNGAVAPDYVFEPNYKLLSLEEIKSYIEKHKHLPEVPSAKEMETNGVNVSEMNMLLLKKIEELTLHMIELKQENGRQNKLIQELTTNKK